MSKLTEAVRFLRESPDLMRRVRQEAPQAIPLLEAMAVDDPIGASEVFASYGDVKEVLDNLAPELREAVLAVLPTFMTMLDAFLPEELLLRALRFLGAREEGDPNG